MPEKTVTITTLPSVAKIFRCGVVNAINVMEEM
jgi:hypothetical protein